MAAWMLVPDKLDLAEATGRFGVVATTTVAFFLVEMGDKTQVATVALAAKYSAFFTVVAGTTMGMLRRMHRWSSSASASCAVCRCGLSSVLLQWSSPCSVSWLPSRCWRDCEAIAST